MEKKKHGAPVSLCSGFLWAEGPVWMHKQKALIFSDVKASTQYRWSEANKLEVYRKNTNFANGNSCDAEGNLVTCEHGRRCISRTDINGQVEIIAEYFEGKRFNSPNDIVIKSDGSLWFTDPPYGIISNEEGYQAPSEIIGCYVYCFDPKTKKTYRVASDTERPNGLAFSPDEKTLYVTDMSIEDFPESGRRHIRAYAVEDDRKLTNPRIVAEITPGIPDGITVDKNGNIYSSCEDGIIVISAQGGEIEKIWVPERVSNCTFGGEKNNELYITASTGLYRVIFDEPML